MLSACERLKLPLPKPDPLTGMLWGGWRAQILVQPPDKERKLFLRLRPHLGSTLLEYRASRGAKLARLNLSEMTEDRLEQWLEQECGVSQEAPSAPIQ